MLSTNWKDARVRERLRRSFAIATEKRERVAEKSVVQGVFRKVRGGFGGFRERETAVAFKSSRELWNREVQEDDKEQSITIDDDDADGDEIVVHVVIVSKVIVIVQIQMFVSHNKVYFLHPK